MVAAARFELAPPKRLVSYIDQKIVTLYLTTLKTRSKRNHSAKTLHKFDAFSLKLTGGYKTRGTSACRPARRNIQNLESRN